MKRAGLLVMAVCLLISNFVSADSFGTGANQFKVDFVTISGDASSLNGTSVGLNNNKPEGFIDPQKDYRVGIYEITNDQWNKFIAEQPSPPFGIPTSAYAEESTFIGDQKPVNHVSWLEAAQFVNWLNTSKGYQPAYKFSGLNNWYYQIWNPSDDGYNPSNPYRNSNAFYFLPSEDEWIKTAYWNGTELQTYSNASNDDLVYLHGTMRPDPAKWNYEYSGGIAPWDVGSGSEELNGTYDMLGNAWEFMESPYRTYLPFEADASRVKRGGCYAFSNGLPLEERQAFNSEYDWNDYAGFRVASIPEPATLSFLAIGGLLLRRKNRK